LTEDPWTLGKCAMKAIQYLGVGVPAVVSPVGANREVVEHGVTGFHAKTEDEWVEDWNVVSKMKHSVGDWGLRGRSVVEARYSRRRRKRRACGSPEGFRHMTAFSTAWSQRSSRRSSISS
jgi:glycosyltransferase involved in cell wall biosynthesis